MSSAPPSSSSAATAASAVQQLAADLSTKTRAHTSKGEWHKALPLLQRCLRLSETVDGAGNPSSAVTAKLLYDIGYIHSVLGEDAIAVVILRQALAVSNADYITKCNASAYLCDALHKCGNLVDAEAQCHATFKLLEEANDVGVLQASSRDHTKVLASIHLYLGIIHVDCNRPFEALRSFEEALPLFESMCDSDRAAIVLGCISKAYLKQGLYEKALEAAQRAVSIDGGTSRSFSNLGSALLGLTRFEEALATYRQALACTLSHARRSIQVAHIHMNIGMTLQGLGRNEEALTSLRQARDMLEELQHTNSTIFADVLYHSARVLALDHRPSEALPFIERALESYRRLYPAGHPRTADCLSILSELCSALGNVDAAERRAAESTSVSRRSQTQCAAAGCPRQMKADGSSLEMCAGCRRTHYCSIECQRADWKATHKAECKQLQSEKLRKG